MNDIGKEDKEEKEENCDTIVKNIIMISPTSKIYKKLERMSKKDDIEISSLCEQIIEDHINSK